MLLFNILSYFGYKHYNKINNNIYIGNINIAQNTDFIKNNYITTIINCSKDIPFYHNHTKNYRIPVNDDLSTASIILMTHYLKHLIPIINNHLNNGEILFIHCRAGMQRSATFLAGLLMYRYKLDKPSAITLIKNKRSICFFPSGNFNISLDIYSNYLL